MAVIQRECYRCDVCGHEWIPMVAEPERCPSRKCRALGWNHGVAKAVPTGNRLGYQTIVEAETPSVAKPVKELLSESLCRHRLYGPLCRLCKEN